METCIYEKFTSSNKLLVPANNAPTPLSFMPALNNTRVMIRTRTLDQRSLVLLKDEYLSYISYFLDTCKEDAGNRQKESQEGRRRQLMDYSVFGRSF